MTPSPRLQRILPLTSMSLAAAWALGAVLVVSAPGCEDNESSVGDSLEEAHSHVEDAADDAHDTASDAADEAGDKMQEAGEKINDALN